MSKLKIQVVFIMDKMFVFLLIGIVYGLALCYSLTVKLIFFKKHKKTPPNGLLDRFLLIFAIAFTLYFWFFGRTYSIL